MPRRNRVDPWGDLHAVTARGLFTGNRGCLIDDGGQPAVRHHRGNLWIICQTSFRDWRHPLDAARTWTPLFFLDDAVALAAGHRPCGLCRRAQYLDYRQAVSAAEHRRRPILAAEMNRRLATERLRRGRGLGRSADRILWSSRIDELPVGTVVLDGNHQPHLLTDDRLQPFAFTGWGVGQARPTGAIVNVLTPPTSVAALGNGFTPVLHETAAFDEPMAAR